jgi:metallo-beta-lactamase family protein
MVDCGLFQGYKALRLRNWDRLPVEPSSLDAVVLTHAHLDHSGYVPLLVKNGFRGRVYCTAGTAQLCGILWPDSAHLAEEDAAYANRKHFSRHQPALPLYQTADVARALRRLELVSFHQRRRVTDDIDVEFSRAGHIIGSAVVTLHVNGRQIVFSGDLGRQQDLVMRPPEPIEHADVLLVESTYGNRAHPSDDPRDTFGAAVTRTVERGGTVIVPAFAVGRTQTILYCLKWLRDQGRLPFVPVYLNSPLAINATKIFAFRGSPAGQRSDRFRLRAADPRKEHR